MSVVRATLGSVELTARVIGEIPRGNLRVPRAEFVRVWGEAERLNDESSGSGDWYVVGVLRTCRWVAGAMVVFEYPHGPVSRPAAAPVTHSRERAHEELIEAETLAAERMSVRLPGGIEDQPGWLEAVVATLAWVWRGSGVPPLDVRPSAAAS